MPRSRAVSRCGSGISRESSQDYGVCAPEILPSADPSLRLKNGCGQDDSMRNRKVDQAWVRSWNSSCQAIWIASSLPSFEALGSPAKSGNSVT